ncbi:hypothetical protein [Sphingomonas sp. Leaf412]|uniref:hypothetical protein n=1 Tax=Sphingomonas sp. Leaf412 TaxID=1736370 RepID=UPI000B14EFAA|nr:hypothetical protein [Sphingomonas sp. Leaf412]
MILPLLLALQTTPVAPIVKGTALPPPGSTEAEVMAPVTRLLTALTTDDAAAVIAVTLPEGTITAVRTGPDGTAQRRTIRWADFAAGLKPDGTRVVETLGQPAIEIDGPVAMVWAPYTVTIDGKPSHCGYDLFDLVRDNGSGGGWKILNVTYSHRTDGCGS